MGDDAVRLRGVPIYDLLGLELEIPEPGRAVGRMDVTPQHYSYAGRMHGGLVFVAIDAVMGYAAHSLVEFRRDVATIDISQRFIRMVHAGPLRVDAEVVHPGRHVMQLTARAVEHRGKLAATATGAFAVLEAREIHGPHPFPPLADVPPETSAT